MSVRSSLESMKSRLFLQFALSVAAVSAWMSPAARVWGAEQPNRDGSPQASPVKTGVRQVLLPVVVLNKHGALATGLTAKNFTLTEDGKAQAISSLSTGSSLPFRLGLLVDTGHSVSAAMDSERKAAESFVDQMLPADGASSGQGNQMFLIHFDREVELLEDFTSSREKLRHEIDGMTPTSGESGGSTGTSEGGNTSSEQNRTRNDEQLYDAIYLASNELMKAQKGRKALVVFSDGADHGSKETMNDAIDAADHANLQVFTIYFKGEEEHAAHGLPGSGGHHTGIGWPGGSGGGWPGGGNGGSGNGGNKGPAPRSEAGVDGRKILLQIAGRTGGQYFEAKRKEDLERIYGEIATLLQQQYLLTYTPDKNNSDDDFHKIVLKVDQKDLTVYTREGYYAP